MAKSLKLLALGSLCLGALSACAVAPGYNESEQEIVNNLTPSKYQPATQEMRQNIKTQDTLAQAAFWSREYQLNPADLEAAVNLAATVRKMGNPGKAVEITQTTRALYPTDPYLTAEYAAALIASERGEEAIEPLDSALRTAPGYARLWSLKGAALDQLEKYDFARQHYMRALKITPNDPNVMANLGLSYALAGDPKTAETWLRRAAAQPGAGSHIQQNLDLVLQLQGKKSVAQSRPATRPQSSPVQPSAQLSPMQRGQTPALRPIQQNPTGSFGYSTNVYTNTGTSGAPKTASEAAMAAARQAKARQQVQGQAPNAATQIVPPKQYSMNAPQQAPAGPAYQQPSYGYPQATTRQSVQPQPRGAARRR